MSWCPFAVKMELQPESDSQAAITPTQFIFHSIAAPWTIERIYEYWRDSTNLESHFGVEYSGRIGQFIGTNTRADANYQANNRALSVETASNLQHTDPWTDAQLDSLVRLADWAATHHGIPRRKCRSWTDPGFGYHRLYPEWSTGGTECPGDARVEQFNKIIIPRLIAGDVPEEDDVPLTAEEIQKVADAAASAVWNFKLASPTAPQGVDPYRSAGTFLRWDDKRQADLLERLAIVTAQAKANGEMLSAVRQALDTLDLTQVSQAVADKLTALRFKLTEG